MKDEDPDTDDTELEDVSEADNDVELDLDKQQSAYDNAGKAKGAPFGRRLLLTGFVLSALTGGVLGVFGSALFAGPDKTVALRAEFQNGLDDMRASAQTQAKQFGATANTVEKNAALRIDALQSENRDLVNKIDAQENIIRQMQLTNQTKSKSFSDRIAVLEAISGDSDEVFNGSGSITARLDTIEKQLQAAKLAQIQKTHPQQEQGVTDATPTTLQKTNFEKTTKSKRISAIPPLDENKQISLDALIDTFPRDALLLGIKAQEDSANKKTSWLKKMLSKHVRVGNDNAPDPYDVVDAAQAALQNGEISKAVNKLNTLNPPVRIKASEWIKNANKFAP